MRKNEYKTLNEFISQYTGVWNPSDGHWFGLDFLYTGVEYRLNTGSMYNAHNTILDDGREAVFGLYKKTYDYDDIANGIYRYELLGEYADMNDLLASTAIGGKPFREVIMDDDTELLGQD